MNQWYNYEKIQIYSKVDGQFIHFIFFYYYLLIVASSRKEAPVSKKSKTDFSIIPPPFLYFIFFPPLLDWRRGIIGGNWMVVGVMRWIETPQNLG